MNDVGAIGRWLLAAGLLIGGVTAAASAYAQGSAAQRHACGPDAVRLCREFIPDVAKVTACMAAKKAELSEACRNEMFAAKPAAPVVASSHRNTRAERRAERRAARSAKAGCEMAKGHTKYKHCKVVRTRG